MRTASIREVQHDMGRILEWVASGEEVTITRHRRAVARLLPAASSRKPAPGRMPDIGGRLRKVFGQKVISDKMMRSIWDENRGTY